MTFPRNVFFLIQIGTDQLDDFFGFRESIFLKLRKYQIAVNQNIETMKFPRFQLHVYGKHFFDFYRQPGGC